MEVGLSKEEIGRYGRQLILPEWGVKGQSMIKSCSVLIVGVGGLGCPASLYLATAGVGHLGLLDYDKVELGNLHRQVLHSEQKEGLRKVDSALKSLVAVNSMLKCTTHHLLLSRENAMDILTGYDIVLDCTDNVATRYLLNDACVLLGKPLVSGSALRFEGQLTVYHHKGSPCYRCLFPEPPPANTVTNCSDGGVAGPVAGVIGTMQALEAIKIATGIGMVLAGRMLVYDGLCGSVRTVKLRPRQIKCSVCGDQPSIVSLIDYEKFCGSCADDKVHNVSLLDAEDRISCQDYKVLLDSRSKHLLVDVRDNVEFDICHLQNAINLPLKVLQSDTTNRILQLQSMVKELSKDSSCDLDPVCVYFCCRRGNDSQQAVLLLKQALEETLPLSNAISFKLKDMIGGLTEWADTVDHTFPKY